MERTISVHQRYVSIATIRYNICYVYNTNMMQCQRSGLSVINGHTFLDASYKLLCCSHQHSNACQTHGTKCSHMRRDFVLTPHVNGLVRQWKSHYDDKLCWISMGSCLSLRQPVCWSLMSAVYERPQSLHGGQMISRLCFIPSYHAVYSLNEPHSLSYSDFEQLLKHSGCIKLQYIQRQPFQRLLNSIKIQRADFLAGSA